MSPVGTHLLRCSLLLLACEAWIASPQAPRLVRGLLPRYTIHPSSHPTFRDCSFTGSEPLVIQWSYEGKNLPSEPTSGPYYTSEGVLVLERATSGDSGNYTCTGSNSLGNLSVSSIITITSSPESSIARRWWMLFIYAVLAWLLLSALISAWFCWNKKRTSRNKPPPVDKNECFAIDHEGTVENQPRSRLSAEFTVPSSGLGYPNPAYTWEGEGQHGVTQEEVVERSRDTSGNQVTTRIITTSSKEYFYVPPDTTSWPQIRQSKRGSGTDAKLQLMETVEESMH